ncbi:MAG: Small ribosomal subunit biogenesis GTPase RsgA [Chlamydiia bacterium]|nr:Small ribosomal subunit biogenesis GTPase RsgA [Chlamydiia bacterium]
MVDDRYYDQEEDFHAQNTKRQRKEAKEATKRDRSKYKKTDQDKRDKQKQPFIPPKGSVEGRVIATCSAQVTVDTETGPLECHLGGRFKKEVGKEKNLIAIGDQVTVLDGLIIHIAPRTTELYRADNLHRRKKQLIAANVDYVIITASAELPHFKPALIDRYLIATMQGNLKPIIVINKMDLSNDDPYFEEMKTLYASLDIPIFLTSTIDKRGLEPLKAFLHNKTFVFSGQSGVGKSSLINALYQQTLHTKEVVSKTEKGSHTTTASTLIPLEGGGFCVDTPGIKSFGLLDLTPDLIHAFFKEFAPYAANCQFANCSHTHEPKCGVKKALEENAISPFRYESYCTLILNETH